MKKIVTMLVISLLVLSMIFVVPLIHAGATIWTDKADYSPGEVPIISGSGFLSNAAVTVTITRPDSTVDTISALTDEYGAFSCSYELDGITGTYTVTATDGTNTATTTFTDSTITIRVSRDTPTAASFSTASESTFSVKFRVDNDNTGGDTGRTISGTYALTFSGLSLVSGPSSSGTFSGLAKGSPIYYQWTFKAPIGPATGSITLSVAITSVSPSRAFLPGDKTSDSISYTITVLAPPDTTPPVVSISAPANGAYYKTVNVPAKAFTVVELNPYTVVESGYSTSEGVHTYTVTATDAAGNVGSASVTYTVDNTPPVVTITAPAAGYYKTSTLPALAYSVVEINPHSEVVSGWGTTEGAHTVTVTSSDAAGNVGSASVTYTVDNTPPETSIIDGPTGWIKDQSATFSWTGSDDVTATANLVYSWNLDGGAWSAYSLATSTTLAGLTEGSHTFYVMAKDEAGNVDPTPAERSLSVDITAPKTSDNYDGLWHKVDFTITLTASDGTGSGVAQTYYKINDGPTKTVSANGQPQITVESATNKLEYWSVDNAGNEESHHTLTTIKLDKTPPVTTKTLEGTKGTNDWYISDVTVTLSAFDATSGVKEIHYILDSGTEIVVSGDTTTFTISTDGTHSLEHWAVDNAGNEENHVTQNIMIDKTPPVVTLTPDRSADSNGWYNHAVTWTVSGVDNLGGAVTVDGPFTYSGPDSASASVTGHATDEAGNVGSATVSFQYDATPPVVTIALPNPGTYLLNQPGLMATWTATDPAPGSGVAPPNTGTVPIDTSSVGTKTLTLPAGTAYDVAGSPSALVTATYYVHYNFGGFRQPINTDGSSVFKLGSTVPVKFQLRDANGAFVTNAVAKIYVAKMSNGIDGTDFEAVSTSAATTGILFRYDFTDNQYIFNLSTKNLLKGTWQIKVLLDDGETYNVNICLR